MPCVPYKLEKKYILNAYMFKESPAQICQRPESRVPPALHYKGGSLCSLHLAVAEVRCKGAGHRSVSVGAAKAER